MNRKEKHFTSMNRIVSVSVMQISGISYKIIIFKQGPGREKGE